MINDSTSSRGFPNKNNPQISVTMGFSGDSVVKNLPGHAGDAGRRHKFDPWVGKIPWRRAWQPTPVFLPGEFPWTEEPGKLQSRGLQRVGHDLATKQTKMKCDKA